MGLPGGKKFDDMSSHFDTIPTERQPNGPTSCDNIVRAIHTSRAVKTVAAIPSLWL